MEDKDKRNKEFKIRIHNYILRLIKFLTALPKSDVSRVIINQLMRSGTSIGANYFEAKGASSRKDYQNFFSYSLKSANESNFWLVILRDAKLVPVSQSSEIDWLSRETDSLANIFASSIITLKKKVDNI